MRRPRAVDDGGVRNGLLLAAAGERHLDSHTLANVHDPLAPSRRYVSVLPDATSPTNGATTPSLPNTASTRAGRERSTCASSVAGSDTCTSRPPAAAGSRNRPRTTLLPTLDIATVRLEADALGGVRGEDDLAQVRVLDRLDLRRLLALPLGAGVSAAVACPDDDRQEQDAVRLRRGIVRPPVIIVARWTSGDRGSVTTSVEVTRPPTTMTAIGWAISCPATSRSRSAAGARRMTIAGHHHGRQLLARPATTSADPGRHAPPRSSPPVALEQGDARCARRSQHRKEATATPERHGVIGEERRRHAARQREREA